MKQLAIKLLICTLLSIVLSQFDTLEVSEKGVEILFTVTSIIFSVGMSLIVTSSTQSIHNIDIKKRIQRWKEAACRNYIYNFLALSIIYMIINGLYLKNTYTINLSSLSLKFKPSLSMLVITCFFNIYFVLKLGNVLKLNGKIEKALDEELENK